eukprot:TRINITY_DN3582_c0_g1_i1.p1 TRINITY_DN3582_c0_g1~~TRINITY_DN3582_c0_g1_i1.p1  ORF type:complete len:488 (-),score=115.33 TRINITY_DN3582_c0_g1_i1:61-1524(-)
MAKLVLLFETSSGYGLFERTESEEIAAESPEVQASLVDFSRFSKIVHLKSFMPFASAESALENINAVSEGIMHDQLKAFLELHLVKGGKKGGKVQLAVQDDKLGGMISETLSISCVKNKNVLELFRALRLHAPKFIEELKEGDFEKAQLGLGHSYSRSKVKFNVNRADNMIIQSICLLDTLDKDFNTFSMRVKEWYSWHFPELVKIVSENAMYARTVRYIKNKSTLDESKLPGLQEIVLDDTKAREIYDAARSSMGTDISDLDMLNVEKFAIRVCHLAEYRQQLQEYLSKKMGDVAPNLTALIGEHVGARLISHAGSLTNLAKAPASTIQILGAEKALFRALKTRGNTPKYGLIFHSSFIGRASAKNKGRISRYLANKCAVASRIDAFSDVPTRVFGEKLHEQVDARLRFYDSGVLPAKNIDVMRSAISEAGTAKPPAAEGVSGKKRKRKEKKDKKDKKKKADKAEKAEKAKPKKKAKTEKKKDKKK